MNCRVMSELNSYEIIESRKASFEEKHLGQIQAKALEIAGSCSDSEFIEQLREALPSEFIENLGKQALKNPSTCPIQNFGEIVEQIAKDHFFDKAFSMLWSEQ